MKNHPLQSGYSGEATKEVVQAVRRVIVDWDGKNWQLIRKFLEQLPRHPEHQDLDDWQPVDVRMYFAISQIALRRDLASVFPLSEPITMQAVSNWNHVSET